MIYKQLKATNKPRGKDIGYAKQTWQELEDLYRGGYHLAEPSRSSKYLNRAVGEQEERYNERSRIAAYIGYFAQQVNAYVAALFAQPITVIPAGDAEDPNTPGELPDQEVYAEFAENADLCGSAFSQVLAKATEYALCKKKGLLALDFPHVEGEKPKNRAESDAMGAARPYVVAVDPEELLSWEIDTEVQRVADLGPDGRGGSNSIRYTVGTYAWCVLHKETSHREGPDQDELITEEFRVWRRDEKGQVAWELYRIEKPKAGGTIPENTEVPMEDSGTTTFREIPVVRFELPDPLWLGNVLGKLCLEHWQRRSTLLAAQQRALLVIPQVKLGPEVPNVGGAIPAERAQDPSRGDDPKRQLEQKGYLVFGTEDGGVSFASPPTAAFEIVDRQLKELVDEIHRIAGRMASSISSTSVALGRSGESKDADQHDFTVVLKALGAIVRDAARRCYTVFSEARGDDVRWTVHGCDRFTAREDRATVISEEQALDGLQVPSPTARTELAIRRAARLLPGLAPATQAQIRKEVTEAMTRTTSNRVPVTDTDRAKVFRAREIREGEGFTPFGDERDEMTIPQLDAAAMVGSGAPPGAEPSAPSAPATEPPVKPTITLPAKKAAVPPVAPKKPSKPPGKQPSVRVATPPKPKRKAPRRATFAAKGG